MDWLARAKASFVTDIGQLDAGGQSQLQRAVRRGELRKIKAPYGGIAAMKTSYFGDMTAFETSQNYDRQRLINAIDLDMQTLARMEAEPGWRSESELKVVHASSGELKASGRTAASRPRRSVAAWGEN